MKKEEKQSLYKNIMLFISEILDEWIDDQIFQQKSLKELGELFYQKIILEVENATVELINESIKRYTPRGKKCCTQEEYYIALCEILHYKKVPSEVLSEVEKEYDEIFVQKYGSVTQKYRSEKKRIDNELNQTKNTANAIKNASPSYSLLRDISTDEQKLYELAAKCNSLRTRKEMISFALEYVTSRLSEFCDIDDPQNVNMAKKAETIKLSKEDSYSVDVAFSSYRDYVDIVEDDLDRPYALFYKVKIYTIIEEARKKYHSSYAKTDEATIAEFKEYIKNIPKIDELHSFKTSNLDAYNSALDHLFENYNLMDGLLNNLESSICLRERKNIILKAIDLFRQCEYELFNSIIPIQMEGMFTDYLQETTVFLRFSKMNLYLDDVLKDKIRHLQEVKSDIYPEAVEYFMYYFNNLIRNRIAHGKYKGYSDNKIQDEIYAKELFLDMGMLVHLLSRKSETEKMYRFIHGYQDYYAKRVSTRKNHPCFEALFNDMIGNKTIVSYDTVERFRPMQIAYWLVNPYYEKIYTKVSDNSELLNLRNEFLSKDFWQYVLDRLNSVLTHGYDYLNIDREFISVVNGLFQCNITPNVKQVLAKVNATLQKIKSMPQNHN